MPLRAYHHSSRNPPTALDHLLAHPYGIGVAVFQIVGGIAQLTTLAFPGITVSRSLDQMANGLVVILCSLLIIGGVLVILGIFDNDEDLMRGFRRERTGLILSGTAWVIFSIAIFVAFPSSVLTWAFGLVPFGGAALRVWATFLEERYLRQATNGD